MPDPQVNMTGSLIGLPGCIGIQSALLMVIENGNDPVLYVLGDVSTSIQAGGWAHYEQRGMYQLGL